MIEIDLHSRKPIYEQLKEQITKLLMLGLLEESSRLPSVRTLARDIGINPNTVQKAYQQLEQEGILYTVTGKGSFLSAENVIRKQVQKKSLDEVSQSVKNASLNGCSKDDIIEFVENALQSAEILKNKPLKIDEKNIKE